VQTDIIPLVYYSLFSLKLMSILCDRLILEDYHVLVILRILNLTKRFWLLKNILGF